MNTPFDLDLGARLQAATELINAYTARVKRTHGDMTPDDLRPAAVAIERPAKKPCLDDNSTKLSDLPPTILERIFESQPLARQPYTALFYFCGNRAFNDMLLKTTRGLRLHTTAYTKYSERVKSAIPIAAITIENINYSVIRRLPWQNLQFLDLEDLDDDTENPLYSRFSLFSNQPGFDTTKIQTLRLVSHAPVANAFAYLPQFAMGETEADRRARLDRVWPNLKRFCVGELISPIVHAYLIMPSSLTELGLEYVNPDLGDSYFRLSQTIDAVMSCNPNILHLQYYGTEPQYLLFNLEACIKHVPESVHCYLPRATPKIRTFFGGTAPAREYIFTVNSQRNVLIENLDVSHDTDVSVLCESAPALYYGDQFEYNHKADCFKIDVTLEDAGKLFENMQAMAKHVRHATHFTLTTFALTQEIMTCVNAVGYTTLTALDLSLTTCPSREVFAALPPTLTSFAFKCETVQPTDLTGVVLPSRLAQFKLIAGRAIDVPLVKMDLCDFLIAAKTLHTLRLCNVILQLSTASSHARVFNRCHTVEWDVQLQMQGQTDGVIEPYRFPAAKRLIVSNDAMAHPAFFALFDLTPQHDERLWLRIMCDVPADADPTIPPPTVDWSHAHAVKLRHRLDELDICTSNYTAILDNGKTVRECFPRLWKVQFGMGHTIITKAVLDDVCVRVILPMLNDGRRAYITNPSVKALQALFLPKHNVWTKTKTPQKHWPLLGHNQSIQLAYCNVNDVYPILISAEFVNALKSSSTQLKLHFEKPLTAAQISNLGGTELKYTRILA